MRFSKNLVEIAVTTTPSMPFFTANLSVSIALACSAPETMVSSAGAEAVLGYGNLTSAKNSKLLHTIPAEPIHS
jgi:hypothetical protein